MSDSINFFQILADATIFEHAMDKAIAKTKEFAGDFNKMRTQVEADSAAVDTAASRVRGPSSTGRSGGAKEAGTGFDLVSSGGLALGYGALAGVAALTGIGAAIQSAVTSYASYSAEVLRNSQALDMNAQELQTWQKIGEKVGVDTQSMTLDFERFAKNLSEEGSPALKLAGVDLQQLGITSTNTGTAILQLADYFHTHNDQAEKAAIASALFGRSGMELIPILDQGSAAFKSYEAELQNMGVLLSNSDLVAGANAQVAIEKLGEAFDGAKNRLLSAVLPGFTTFFGQLTNILEHNQGMFVSLGQTVDNVLLTITGLLAGLTGTNLTDLTQPPKDAGAAYDGLANSANDASQSIDNTTNSTKAAKDALSELQAQTQLQIDAIDTQIQQMDDLTAAANDSYDAQKQALQDQYDQVTYVNDSRRRQGEDLVTYERRLEQLNTQEKIKALDDAKSTFDRQQADKKRALDDERANLQRVLNQEVNSQKDAAAQAAAANQQAMALSGQAVNQFATQSVPAALSRAQAAVLQNAMQMGRDLSDIFTDKNGSRSKAAEDLGNRLGQAFVDGMESGLANQLMNSPLTLPGMAKGDAGALGGLVQQWLKSLPSEFSFLTGHATGYIGSSEHLARISEGGTREAVIPLDSSPNSLALTRAAGLDKLVMRAAGARGQTAAGATVFNTTFNGPVADQLVASRVMQRLQSEARRKGLLHTAGRG